MVLESVNLGIHLYQADASAQLQNLFQQAERANAQLIASQGSDQAKAAAAGQVQTTEQTENPNIQGDSRGAHSHTLSQEGEKKKEEAPPKPKPPEDPTGRGRIVDLTG